MPDPTPEPTPAPTPTPSPTPSPEPPVPLIPPVAPTPPGDPPPAPKPGDPPAPAPEPLTFEAFTLPEGFVVSDDQKTAFLGIMNDDKLDPKGRAQALIDMQYAATKDASEKSTQAWYDVQNAWIAEAKADPEIGGDKLAPTLGLIDRAIETYGAPADQQALREAFAYTGFGNNKQAIKFVAHLARMAKIGEGGPVPAPGVPRTEAEAAKLIYSSSNMK